MTPSAQHPGPGAIDLLARLEAAHASARMEGWDFSRLDGALVSDEPWWDFENDCLDAMRGARIGAIDLGTGGGERLSALLDRLAEETKVLPHVLATEGWQPNLPIARDRLAPRGVSVNSYDSEAGGPIGMHDGSVDVVMSRHESFDAAEVARILTPGGRFLTQQVDGLDAPELHEWFDSPFLYSEVTIENQSRVLEAAGMRIDRADSWSGSMTFADSVALVTYLGLVPWDAPDFTVSVHADRLLELESASPIGVTQRRFRIYATKA